MSAKLGHVRLGHVRLGHVRLRQDKDIRNIIDVKYTPTKKVVAMENVGYHGNILQLMIG